MKIKYVISLCGLVLFTGVSYCAASNDDFLDELSAESQLLIAVKEGNVMLLSKALAARAKINVRDLDGRTPLMIAAINGLTVMLTILLENKAAVNKTDMYNFTALMLAVEAHPRYYDGRESEIGLLIRAGADSNAVLKSAIDRHDKVGAELLMKCEADMSGLSQAQKEQLGRWGLLGG